MIGINDLPATMPGSMREQLIALAPYMTAYNMKGNGGFVIDMKIPIEAFVTYDINREELAAHGMALSVQVEQPGEIDFSGSCGRVIRQAQFADVQLTYL